jgi:hypothetical protein
MRVAGPTALGRVPRYPAGVVVSKGTLCAGLLVAVECCSMAQTAPDRSTPMTQADRGREYLRNLVSPAALVAATAGAGIGQWEDTPGEWRQGAEGYGRRVASSYGKHVVGQTLLFGAASLLHEDDRYFPVPRRGFQARLSYALESTLVARRDDGTRTLSYSRFGSDLGAAFLSRLWQPPSTRGPGAAMRSFGISVGVQTGFNVAREFVPFLRRR